MDCKQHEDLGAKPSFELTLQSRPEVTRWQQWGKQGSVRMHFEKPTGPGYGLEVAGKQKITVWFVQRTRSKMVRRGNSSAHCNTRPLRRLCIKDY